VKNSKERSKCVLDRDKFNMGMRSKGVRLHQEDLVVDVYLCIQYYHACLEGPQTGVFARGYPLTPFIVSVDKADACVVDELYLRSMIFPKEIQASIEAVRETGGDEHKAPPARRGPLVERRGMYGC
jgi:hypothetical protein